MAIQFQNRRGTKAENDAFTGAQGEVVVDTTNNLLRLHDGVTEGGHIIGENIIEGASFVDKLKVFSYIDTVYARANSTSNVSVGLSTDNGVAEYTLAKDVDGLYLLLKGVAGDKVDIDDYIKPTLTGTGFTGAESTYYTNKVGDSFSFSFRGSSFSLSHYSDNRGGIWKFWIDGVDVGQISVFSNDPITYNKTRVVSGLTDTTHKVTAVFMGNDPLNPPSGGVSRGWFVYDSDSSGNNSTILGIETIEKKVISGGVDIISQNSITDFAINASRVDHGALGSWCPAHSSDTGVCQDVSSFVYIDGKLVNSDLTVALPEVTEIKELCIVNQYTAYNKYDTGLLYPMWTGYLTQTVNKDGLKINHRIEMIEDVEVFIGYMTMLPSDSDHVTAALFSQGEKFKPLATTTTINTNVKNTNNSVCFVDEVAGGTKAVAMDCNLKETLRVFNGNNAKTDSIYLNQRDNSIMKAYWKFAENEVLPKGSIYRVQNHYFIAPYLRYSYGI